MAPPAVEATQSGADTPDPPPAPEDAPARTGSPAVAAALSVVPGAGQLYNRQPGKALFFLLATGLTIVPSLVFIAHGGDVGQAILGSHRSGRPDGDLGPAIVAMLSVLGFLVVFLIGLAFWASAVVDARRSASPAGVTAGDGRRWWFVRL